MNSLPGQQGPSHTNDITALAFSHDSKLLATASYDWTVRIWDVESRTQQTVIPLPAYTYVIDIAFLADNRRLVFATSWQLYFWSKDSGLTQYFADDLEQLLFPVLPEGCFARRRNDSLFLLQIEGDTVFEKLLGSFPNLEWATISNNGRLMAIHSNDKVTLIDLESTLDH